MLGLPLNSFRNAKCRDIPEITFCAKKNRPETFASQVGLFPNLLACYDPTFWEIVGLTPI